MTADNQPGHIDQIKQTNAGMVYRLIDTAGPVSRIELSKRALLAPASITKIVREMLEARLVEETEFQEAGGRGRPAIGLVVDTASWHFLAVRIGNGDITLALRDLSCNIVVEEQFALLSSEPHTLLQRIIDQIDQFFVLHQHRLERLTAIAIVLPGSVDSRSGIVRNMPYYGIVDMDLGPQLLQRTGLPVFIQSEIPAWTLAESLFGAAKEARDVLHVVIDRQVGAGIITGGRLLHGTSGARVEIGHTQIDPEGKRCYCGNRGCLETIVSTDSLLAAASRAGVATPPNNMTQETLTIEALCKAAMSGDRLARQIIIDAGRRVGQIAAIMVNLFNPKKILIGSPLNEARQILFPAIEDCLRQQTFPAYGHALTIEPASFSNTGTMPAAALVKEALYNGTLLVKLLQG